MLLKSSQLLCNVTIKGQALIPINVWEKLDATGFVKIQSGEEMPYLSAKYKGLRISQNANSFTIKNSLHKFSKAHNAGLFTLSDCTQVINELSNCCSVDIWETKMPKFEFGLNIPVSQNPSLYLAQMQGFKSRQLFQFDSNDRGQTLFFKTADYKFKIYNKTRQAGLNQNILRLEITRLNAAHYLPNLKMVSDVVNKQGFSILSEQIVKQFQKVQFAQSNKINGIKCTDFILYHFFNATSTANAKQLIKQEFGTKKAYYYTAKYNKLQKNRLMQNQFQHEILNGINKQIAQILGSIPNL